MMTNTIDYYNSNASLFSSSTANVSFTEIPDRFLSHLKFESKILDFGCGSGRDSLYFSKKGFIVDAIDGSSELCKIARENTGLPVKEMLFSELSAVEEYDGIWACSSVLHLPMEELIPVFGKMITALKPDGWIYTSFKYGSTEGERNGRYFTDFTEEKMEKFLAPFTKVSLREMWISGDVRSGREDEKWLNILIQKTDMT